MSDASTQKFDPTESVRTLTSAPFKEQSMTLREHQDTDRHYIGDSLPMPSNSQVRNIGVPGNAAGVLPFPARVDHVHEMAPVWGYYNAALKAYAPGSAYINNLAWIGARNMLSGTQIIVFPYAGVYLVQIHLGISRVTAGLFTNEFNFVMTYNSNTDKYLSRYSMFDVPNLMYAHAVDVAVVNANDNVQFKVEQNDTSNWNIIVYQIVVLRLSGLAPS